MKKYYLVSSLLIAIAIILTFSSFNSSIQQKNNQDTEQGYVLVRTTEIYGMMPSSIITIYEDGTVEKEPLKKLNAKTMEENLFSIHSKLNSLRSKGYKLLSATGGTSDNIICTTYLFCKTVE